MNENGWDYVFLFSNEPVPSLIEKVQCAIDAGRRVAVVYMSRPWRPLRMDSLSGAAAVFPIAVAHHGVDLRRLTSYFTTTCWLRKEIFATASPNCEVYADAVDLLAVAQLAAWGKPRRFRFDVRDLHPLQLGAGPIARLVQLVERLLLRQVAVLILTSSEHWHRYYQKRYAGAVIFVSNVPARAPWIGFRRARSERFIVGFIGVTRYRRSLETLIAAVVSLNQKGLPIYLRIAGGGVLDDLRARANHVPFIEFEGPFSYSEAAQRLFADLAIINSVYDADDANVQLAISNKYYEAQITGIPLMVAGDTHLANLVRNSGIGKAVRFDEVADVASVIEEAYNGAEWYQAAREALSNIDVDDLFKQHEAEIRAAVLGPARCALTSPSPVGGADQQASCVHHSID